MLSQEVSRLESLSLDLNGMDELIEDLEKAVSYYPDEARRTLKKTSYRFRGHVKKLVREVAETDENLTTGFRVDEPKKLGMDMEAYFKGEGKKNPHWHLFENGHEIIIPFKRNGKRRTDGGENRGFVPGRRIMPEARETFQPVLVEALDEMTDRILREAGLK